MKYRFLCFSLGILLTGIIGELHPFEVSKKTTNLRNVKHSKISSKAKSQDILDTKFYSKTYLNFNFINVGGEGYKESTLKRSEILFFLSIPFIFLSHIIALATTYLLATRDNAFLNFPAETFFFAGASSLMMAGGIMYLDYQKNKTLSNDIQSTNDYRKFRLRYTHSL